MNDKFMEPSTAGHSSRTFGKVQVVEYLITMISKAAGLQSTQQYPEYPDHLRNCKPRKRSTHSHVKTVANDAISLNCSCSCSRRVVAAAIRRQSEPSGDSSSPSTAAGQEAALYLAISRCNNPKGGEDSRALEKEVEKVSMNLIECQLPLSKGDALKFLPGTWTLLYIGKSQILATQSFKESTDTDMLRSFSDSCYSLVRKYFPLLAGTSLGSRSASGSTNKQTIDIENGKVSNNVIFKGPGGLKGELIVDGIAHLVESQDKHPVRLEVEFESFRLFLDGSEILNLSLRFLRPRGFVDTMYINERLRVSVGDKGSLFVARRDP